MIAGLRHWVEWLFDPHRDHSPALGALMQDMAAQQAQAMGGPAAKQVALGYGNAPEPSYGVIGMSGGPFTDCFVHDGPAMAQRLTITLPLDLAAWIDAERGTATREEFALGRLYIAKIVGDLQHGDIRSMQEAMRTHGVAAALRKAGSDDKGR